MSMTVQSASQPASFLAPFMRAGYEVQEPQLEPKRQKRCDEFEEAFIACLCDKQTDSGKNAHALNANLRRCLFSLPPQKVNLPLLIKQIKQTGCNVVATSAGLFEALFKMHFKSKVFHLALRECIDDNKAGFNPNRHLLLTHLLNCFLTLPPQELDPLKAKLIEAGCKEPFAANELLFEKLQQLVTLPKVESNAFRQLRLLFTVCVKAEESGLNPNSGFLATQLKAAFAALATEEREPFIKKLELPQQLGKVLDFFEQLKGTIEPMPMDSFDQVVPQTPLKPGWNFTSHQRVYGSPFCCHPMVADFRVALETCYLAKRAGLDPNAKELLDHLKQRFHKLPFEVIRPLWEEMDCVEITNGNSYYTFPNDSCSRLIDIVTPCPGKIEREGGHTNHKTEERFLKGNRY